MATVFDRALDAAKRIIKKAFNAVKRLLTWLGDLIVKIVVIALIIAAIYFIFVGAYVLSALLLVAAFLVHPGVAGDVLGDVAEAAGEVAEVAFDVGGEIADAFFSTDFGRSVKWVGLGILGVWGASTLLASRNKNTEVVAVASDYNSQSDSLNSDDFSGV